MEPVWLGGGDCKPVVTQLFIYYSNGLPNFSFSEWLAKSNKYKIEKQPFYSVVI